MQLIEPSLVIPTLKRFPIKIDSVEKYFTLDLQFDVVPAGAKARIRFTNVPYPSGDIMLAKGTNPPELEADLAAIPEKIWFAKVHIYAAYAWLEIETPSPITEINCVVRQIPNSER